jgi:hypothetical protein
VIVFRGCFNYGQQGKCLERATAAFLTLLGQLPSTWCQQNRASLGKTTDWSPLLTNPRQEMMLQDQSKNWSSNRTVLLH